MCNAEINDPPIPFLYEPGFVSSRLWLESVRRSRIWKKPCGERGKMALSQESPGVYWLILYHENFFCVVCVCVCVHTLKLCLVLCNPMDCSPSGFSVHGIFQAGIPTRFAISFGGSSWPKNWTASLLSPGLAGGFFSAGSIWKPIFCVLLFY